VYNDKRANPEGRLPDDTWVLRPQGSEAFGAGTDSWYISRVCGTFKERVPGAANQLPEQLVGRIVRACSNENQTVLDCMAGTGTVPAVAKKLGRHYIGVEKSSKFAKLAAARLDAVTVGDALDGLVPHGD
jgi:site-specific DNA-methyltransferase (adenine-specific)